MVCMTPGGLSAIQNATRNCTELPPGMQRARCASGGAVVKRDPAKRAKLGKRTPKLVKPGFEEALVPKGGEQLDKHQLAVAAMKAKSLFGNKVDYVVQTQLLSKAKENKPFFPY